MGFRLVLLLLIVVVVVHVVETTDQHTTRQVGGQASSPSSPPLPPPRRGGRHPRGSSERARTPQLRQQIQQRQTNSLTSIIVRRSLQDAKQKDSLGKSDGRGGAGALAWANGKNRPMMTFAPAASPACPPSQPNSGDDCSDLDVGQECEYGEEQRCCGRILTRFLCTCQADNTYSCIGRGFGSGPDDPCPCAEGDDPICPDFGTNIFNTRCDPDYWGDTICPSPGITSGEQLECLETCDGSLIDVGPLSASCSCNPFTQVYSCMDTVCPNPTLTCLSQDINQVCGGSQDLQCANGLTCVKANDDAQHGLCTDLQATPSPTFADFRITPEGYNCIELQPGELQLRWQVVPGTTPSIQYDLIGRFGRTEYAALGISGSSTMTQMLNSDMTIASFALGARDFYAFQSQQECTSGDGTGVCLDQDYGLQNDVVGTITTQESSNLETGITITRIAYPRPLTSRDTVDGTTQGRETTNSISVTPGEMTRMIWAIGPLRTSTGLPGYHGFNNRGGIDIEFGRTPISDDCPDILSFFDPSGPTPAPVPIVSDCPASLPGDGSPCAFAGQVCTYNEVSCCGFIFVEDVCTCNFDDATFALQFTCGKNLINNGQPCQCDPPGVGTPLCPSGRTPQICDPEYYGDLECPFPDSTPSFQRVLCLTSCDGGFVTDFGFADGTCICNDDTRDYECTESACPAISCPNQGVGEICGGNNGIQTLACGGDLTCEVDDGPQGEGFGICIDPTAPTRSQRETPLGFNCVALSTDLHLRWRIFGNYIEYNIIGRYGDGEYAAIGQAGLNGQVIGSDITVLRFDAESGPPALSVVDYYVSAEQECSGTQGICADTSAGLNNDLLNNIQGANAFTGSDRLTLIRYRRLLDAGEEDWEESPSLESATEVSIEPGETTPIIWALGTINSATGLPMMFSTQGITNVELGRPVSDQCSLI